MRPIKCQALNDFIGKRKYIVTESATAKRKGRVLPFETKWTQVATMINSSSTVVGSFLWNFVKIGNNFNENLVGGVISCRHTTEC